MIKNLVLVGCGHMGYAMLRRWADKKVAETIWVVTPHKESLHGLDAHGVRYVPYPSALPEGVAADVVVFAVRPEILGEVLKDYKNSNSLFMSVAAGKKLDFYEAILGSRARIIRVMPNLPAKYGEGATLLVKNSFATQADKNCAEHLLSGLGLVAWLEKEELIDAATALSGCGPAYFYLLADILGDVGAEMGLPPDLAHQLARQTFQGSATLWREEKASAENLYRNIAVKGGMTEAALSALQDKDALKTLMKRAMEAAVMRGRQLSS